MPVIEVNNLRKVYGDITAVKDISFKVESGEIFGIVGPNGAGKTTTIEMMEEYVLPTPARSLSLAYIPSRTVRNYGKELGCNCSKQLYPIV